MIESSRLTPKPHIDPPSLWTIHDVARYLSCSTKTVLALVRTENLPCFRLRSRLRFDRSDVLRWTRQRMEER